jgi:hypothetical protein
MIEQLNMSIMPPFEFYQAPNDPEQWRAEKIKALESEVEGYQVVYGTQIREYEEKKEFAKLLLESFNG